FSSRRRHTRCLSDWSSDVCSSDLIEVRNRGLRKSSGLTFMRLSPGLLSAGEPDACRASRQKGRRLPKMAVPTRTRVAPSSTATRSEERRVGKAGSCQGARDHEQEK